MRRWILAAALIALAACAPASRSPRPAQGPRVIFVGLDGADWQLLDRFIADGTMPNLAALVRDGQRGMLRTQHPPLSPLVWTTMMTGVSPLEHRVLDFTRFHPATHEREPITSDERAVPAIWNMVSAAGRKVDVFGLWATYPAEQINGVMVSDRLFSFQYAAAAPPRSVSPQQDEEWARGVVREVDTGTGFDVLQGYVPSLTNDEYQVLAAGRDPFADPVTALRRVLVETEVIHRLASERIARDRPDLAVVYFQGTDAIGHLFAPYYPPKLDGVKAEPFERYHDVPRRYFARVDAILGDYRRLARESGAILFLASDHGFHWIDGRSTQSSVAVATAGRWHRDEGIVLQWPRGSAPLPTDVGGICSALLGRLGIPTDVHSYRRAYQRPVAGVSTAAAGEEIAKLEALGYIAGSEQQAVTGGGTRTAGSFDNEGLILREAGRDDDALAAFEGALRVDPHSAAAMWNLSDLLRRLHRDEGRVHALLDAALAADPDEPRWLLARGRDGLERNDCRGALRDFARAVALAPANAIAQASAGTAQLCLGDQIAARASFQRSLALDPNQPELRRLLR